jgi:KUP system potassium uptake protein
MGNHHAHNRVTFASLLITLGIVFGDIGTSPLYVMSAIVGKREITEQLVFGALSCVFWTLTLMTTFKYVFIMLRADNHGEGGILSLYALVRRHYAAFVIAAMLGASALLADGMITPPISISSAIEGLAIDSPEAAATVAHTVTGHASSVDKVVLLFGFHIPVVYLVIAILIFLFLFQRFGTSAVGKAFGPIMLLWFIALAAVGLPWILQHPKILMAFSPHHAVNLLANYPHGFWLLGSVFLCTTGAEALYSDLGHCGKRNIEYAWVFVKICLVINYFGQGAWLLAQADMGNKFLGDITPFYGVVPPSLKVAMVALATVAAIVASQALISAAYTLISEAMSLNLWPRVRVQYPSDAKGQLYIPSVNWLLLAGCIGVVLYFKKSTAMEAAYGLAITLTMMATTTLLVCWLLTKHVKYRFIVLIGLVYGIIEVSFLIANIEKFPEGGWITLLISSVLFGIMFMWFRARKIKNRYREFEPIKPYLQRFQDLSADETVPKYCTHLVYLTSANLTSQVETKIVYSIFNKRPKRADVYWFLHVHYLDDPNTQEYDVEILVPEKVIRVEFRLGFRVQPRINLFLRAVMPELVKQHLINPTSRYPSLAKHNIRGDFRFVVIDRILNTADADLPTSEEIILTGYDMLKKLSLSDEKAFGLDTSSVVIETVPLVVEHIKTPHLKTHKIETINWDKLTNIE